MIKYCISFILGAGLLACSSVHEITVNSESVPVDNEVAVMNAVDSMINPYRDSLESEMDVVIATSEHDFTKGRPNGSLNNWSADAVYDHQVKTMNRTQPVFALLNVGGLRNPISKGDVTVGDIFKLMPFDNEVVWVEMPVETLNDVAAYLVEKGGEPISGAKLENGELVLNGINNETKTYWIITSDYLMNGGDNMSFFEKKVSSHYANILLRDLFIEVAKSQGSLVYNDEKRIML